MKFLLKDAQGRPYRLTSFWVMAEPTVGRATDWTVSLTEPQGRPPGSYIRVRDLKSWMLSQDQGVRFLEYAVEGTRKKSANEVRRIEREQVFAKYLAAIRSEVGHNSSRTPVAVLMPTILDAERRNAYELAIERATPGATPLPEPEMVIEYFRLIKREVTLVEGENSVFLVIDVGAATCNMTIVLSRRDYRVVDASSSRQRVQRLRAIRGDSDRFAGRWVDANLARKLGVDIESEEYAPIEDEILERFERAKIQTSRSGEPTLVDLPGPNPPTVRVGVEDLQDLSRRLWVRLETLVKKIRVQLFDNLNSTEFAKGKFTERLRTRGIVGPTDVLRLLDGVFLAGGTSQLPGFEVAMHRVLFPDGTQVPVHEVGPAYAVAAAAGALAHILRHRYKPPRFRGPRQAVARDEAEESEFSGTLPADILLSFRGRSEVERTDIVALPRDHAVVERGGTVHIQAFPSMVKHETRSTRLVPANPFRYGAVRAVRPVKLTALKDGPRADLVWNADTREARVRSTQLDGAGELFLDMNAYYVREDAPQAPAPKVELRKGMFAMDQSPDLVLDIGMSKTVAVIGCAGVYHLENLEMLAEAGEQAPTPPDPDIVPPAEPDIAEPQPEDEEPDLGGSESEGTDLVEPDPEPPDSGDFRDEHSGQRPRRASREDRDVLPDPPVAPTPLELGAFADALLRTLAEAEARNLGLRADDLLSLLLALSVRPNVLLAGPPGCGKSTLVRVAARLLGLADGNGYHEVAVQAHWTDDRPLFHRKRGILLPMLRAPRPRHLVLFDEINLARPEFFLSRFFHAQERHDDAHGSFDVRNWLTCGTLNIDDTSRPPSPKVVDRCFLLELGAAHRPTPGPRVRDYLGGLTPVGGLLSVDAAPALPPELEEILQRILDRLDSMVVAQNLRQDLLPSRRAHEDIRRFVGLAAALHDRAPRVLDPLDALDRVVESRLLVRISGAVEQVEPLVNALQAEDVLPESLRRSRRRIRLYQQQARMGFVSPWH